MPQNYSHMLQLSMTSITNKYDNYQARK